MIEVTAGDVLDGEKLLDLLGCRRDPLPGESFNDACARLKKAGPRPSYRLYVVRDGDVVFYVGQSQNVINRLWDHLGEGCWARVQGKSNLGRLIKFNLPASRVWQIELLTVEDCQDYGETYGDVSRAEQLLIDYHSPYLNVKGNRASSGLLPECYKTPWVRR